MSTDKMRAEFEAKFPVPLNPTKYGAFAMQQHKDRLDGWQAASAGQAAEIARLTAKLARTRAAHVVEQELVYQIASCRDPGWGDVSKEEFDAFSESEWRKKRILYTHPQPSADDARVPDLSRLVARLMRELKKADPTHELPMKAMDYLTRHDLIGSPLRADGSLINEGTKP